MLIACANMDVEVAVSMKAFIENAMVTVDNEVRKCKALMDELDTCKGVIITLNTKIKDLDGEIVRLSNFWLQNETSKIRWYDGCSNEEIK